MSLKIFGAPAVAARTAPAHLDLLVPARLPVLDQRGPDRLLAPGPMLVLAVGCSLVFWLLLFLAVA